MASKKKGKKNSVSGTKKELKKKLSKPQDISLKKSAPETKPEKAPKGEPGTKRIPLRKVKASDTASFRDRAYNGPNVVRRTVGSTLEGKAREKLENTVFMEELRNRFADAKRCIMTCADNANGLIWRFFLVGTDKNIRFCTDATFSKGIGMGNPTWTGKKKTTGGFGCVDYVSGDGVIPQRNKPESYRYIPSTEANLEGVTEFMEAMGFERIVAD